MTIKQVKKRIFKLFRPIILGSPAGTKLPDRGNPNYNEETVVNAEFKAFFEDNNYGYDSENIGNPLYKIQVFNNTQQESGWMFNYRKRCEMCDKEHKDNCDFNTSDERNKLKHIITLLQNRDLILVAHWRD